MAIGGFFPGLRAAQNEEQDAGLIAARVAEQLGSTRAASQSEQQRVAADVASRPQPTRSVTITENPDGTETRVETVKNAPKKDPGAEVREAANAPHAKWFEQVIQTLDRSAAAVAPDLDAMETDLQTTEGRRRLLSSVGIQAPGFGEGGLLPWARKADEYDALVKDPNLVRRIVASEEAKRFAAHAGLSRPFASDVADEQTRTRLDAAETRQQQKASTSDRRNAIIDLTRLDTSNFESPEKVVDWVKMGYAPEEWETVKGYLEPAARIKYAQDARTREEKNIKLTIAENDAQIRAIREGRQEERAGLTLEHLALSNERLRQLIERGEQRPVTKAFPGWTADDLVEAVGREDVDQDALLKKANSRLTKIADDINSNIGKIRVLKTEIDGMRKNESWKTTDIAVRQVRMETLEAEQARLLDEKNRLLKAGFGGRRGNQRTVQRADPLGIR